MNQKLVIGVVGSALLIAACASVGYVLGHSQAADSSEWREEKLASYERARKEAAAEAYVAARKHAREKGFAEGKARGARLGSERGARAGTEVAQAELAAIKEEREQEELAELEYTDQLPNGDPGYVLPEEDRSISCVGISAIDGECVGD